MSFDIYLQNMEKLALSPEVVGRAYGKRMAQKFKEGGGKSGFAGWIPSKANLGGMKAQADFAGTPQGQRYLKRFGSMLNDRPRDYMKGLGHASLAALREGHRKD